MITGTSLDHRLADVAETMDPREHGARGAWWACVESDAQPAERAEVDRDLDLDRSIVNGREGLALMSTSPRKTLTEMLICCSMPQ
ncbi:hypothetical protein [Gordonia sp. (in: high G+C Gram-positive bacteria)]|uniref:hypothetical protein n=1 Tax=Gordonia sp. (in: high G+C Gram-positive bacteria) TaxID=84139 RepID=UPI002610957C|nr:hypothetical protein [Gordonia sp. (in: high G+C Gram-positive bacteria)]HMS73909.1 hypothetical protein [Gordonia sp. (in: high G+C Gram-positive bacteria)]